MSSLSGDPQGSFRVTAKELDAMRMERPRPVPVAANTLVVADTRGFHHRTVGQPGTRRRAIHAVLRREPFALTPKQAKRRSS